MNDYIKREDAIKAMARGLGIPYTDFIDVAERCMDDIPPADVVEVVRCKDCKYWDNTTKWAVCTKWSADPYEQANTEKNDYCSYGERKDEGL